MSYVKFGIALWLSYVFAMTAGQLFGQESDSVAIFAPIFAADFEDVLLESPPDNLVIGLNNGQPGGPSLMDLALALPAAAGISNIASLANDRKACSGCSSKFSTYCPSCQSCRSQSAENMKGHCRLMARLLSAAIQDGEQTQDAQRKVIEAALMMIAETSEAKAQAKIAWLEANHQEQLTNLKRQMEKTTPATSSFSLIREWLSPIYTNQNRNFHQLKKIAANGESLSRTVGLLQRKIDAKLEPVLPQTIQNRLYGNSRSAESDSGNQAGYRLLRHQTDRLDPDRSKGFDPSEQADRLRHEIHALQVRLQELREKAVRPANHLEPVFTPDQPLRPLYQR